MKTAIQIIREAYEYAGISPTGLPLNGNMSKEGLTFLNEVLYRLNSDNYFPFTNNTIDGTVKDGTAKICPDEDADFRGEKPLNVSKVLYKRSGLWAPLYRVGYDNIYERRSNNSYPTCYAFSNDEEGNGILTFDNMQGEFECRVIYNKDVGNLDFNDVLKAPPQYEQILKYGVALKVCTRYGLPADVKANIQDEYDSIVSAVKKNNSFKHEIDRPMDNEPSYDDLTLAVLSGRRL